MTAAEWALVVLACAAVLTVLGVCCVLGGDSPDDDEYGPRNVPDPDAQRLSPAWEHDPTRDDT